MFDESRTAVKVSGTGKTKMLIIAGALVLVILLGVTVLLGWQYMALKHQQSPTTTAATADQTTKRVLAEVGAVYKLPDSEQPTVARVDNPAELGKQPFFKPAQKGDYVLVYPKAGLGLIYRESIHKLVNVGPITVADNAHAAQGTTASQ